MLAEGYSLPLTTMILFWENSLSGATGNSFGTDAKALNAFEIQGINNYPLHLNLLKTKELKKVRST